MQLSPCARQLYLEEKMKVKTKIITQAVFYKHLLQFTDRRPARRCFPV